VIGLRLEHNLVVKWVLTQKRDPVISAVLQFCDIGVQHVTHLDLALATVLWTLGHTSSITCR